MGKKGFCIAALSTAGILLLAVTLFVDWVDPFFHRRAPGEAEVFLEERYENAGIAANSDYENVLMGTSLVCNYRASWFTEATGVPTVKLGYRNGDLSEFDAIMEVVERTHPEIRQVWFGLDLNILIRTGNRAAELPMYLYNQNPLDDVNYYWNGDVLERCKLVLESRADGTAEPIDAAYLLTGKNTFSRETALASYYRPAVQAEQKPADAYFAACDANVAVVESWLEEMPDTQFTIFFSPYSILYWDMATRQGDLDARLAALERAITRLAAYDNASICFFMDMEEVITDLDHYMDYIHLAEEVNRSLAEEMIQGEHQVTAETCPQVLDALADFARSYDYDSLFPPEEP